MKIELGAPVKDVITGFEGVMTGWTEYITGCKQVLINPGKLDDKGDPVKGNWYDVARVIVTGTIEPEIAEIIERNRAVPVKANGPDLQAPIK